MDLSKRPLILLLLATLWAGGMVSAQEIVIEPGEPIVIGLMTALRDAEADIGVASTLGVILAQEERYALRFGNSRFSIMTYPFDSACHEMDSAWAAWDLVEFGRTVAVIGPNCSHACLAAAPIFDEAGLTSLSPSCSGPSLTEQGFTSFHRLTNPNDRIARHAIRYLAGELGRQRLAILHHDDPYYGGLAEAAAAEFLSQGGEIVLDRQIEDFEMGEELDAQPELAQVLNEIAAAEADAIYCACSPEWARALLKFPETPHHRIPFFGVAHYWANFLVYHLGMRADGVYFSADYPYAWPAVQDLTARYEALVSDAPHSPYFATAYDAYHILLDAIQAVSVLDDAGNLRIDRAALNAAIRGTSDYAGVSGPIDCDENGECLTMPTAVLQIQDGAYTLLDLSLPESETESEAE